MFTGIVEEIGRVQVNRSGQMTIDAKVVLGETIPGDSIAVNGVCLTVTSLSGDAFTVGITPETLRRSNLGQIDAGDMVNLERPLPLGGRLGGHLVEGHVDGTATVAALRQDGAGMLVTFNTPRALMRYIVEKGYVAVSGLSLTVVSRDATAFQVSLIGYTREHTTAGQLKLFDTVNIEVDIIAKYVEQLVQPAAVGITEAFLKENGF